MQLVAGAKVAGKYELERRIGVGGMGEVWSAVQSPTRKRVALKFLKSAKEESATETEATRKRFVREARAACAVQHPNVVEIHDVLTLEDGSPVMVMEFLAGETLEARLARDGRMALGEIAAVLVRVVSAVGAAHALGIVHRDLKPDNIFLADTADGVDIKVLDFGIAKLTALDGDAAQTGGLTNTGAMLGTPYYMSPEQAFGERSIDHRADIWSLGIILYRAVTGVLPTKADNIGQILKIIMMSEIKPIETIVPELPADLVSLIGRMLSIKRDDRPENLLQVKEVLERYAGVEVAGFGAPMAARLSQTSLDLGDSDARAAAIPPGAADGSVSMAGVATPAAISPAKRPIALFAIVGVTLAVIAGMGIFALSKPPTSAPSTASAPALEGPSAAAPAAATSEEKPAASVAPMAAPPASAPSTAVSAASRASASAPPGAASGPWPPKRTTTATPSAPSTPAPAPAPSPQPATPGGILTAKPIFD